MNTFKAINKSFGITWRNLILTQPFILFMLIFSILSGGLAGVMRNNAAFIVCTLSLLLLITAFLAGWFYMTKKTISFDLDDTTEADDKAYKSFGLVKQFFPGVGEYFLPVTLLGILYLLFTLCVVFLAFKLGIKYIGMPDIDIAKLNAAADSSRDMQAYFSTLPYDKVLSIVKWVSYSFLIAIGIQFFTMWWIPALFYNTKNPLKAFLLGIKFLFRKFGASLGIMLFLMMFNFFISFVTTVSGQNIMLSLLSLLLFFYYATYYIVLIFLYYGQNGEHSAKDYIYSGDDGDGQKLAGSESGEEN